MPANKKLLVLPGDGIGPEVMGEVRRVMDWMAVRRAVSFDLTEGLVGGAAIDSTATRNPESATNGRRSQPASNTSGARPTDRTSSKNSSNE